MPNQVLVLIETPEDEIIEVANRPIVFQCKTVPAGFEDKVLWIVPEEQYATNKLGKGKIFSTSFNSTGVKQVIAIGPSGEYSEVEIDRRLIDPIPETPVNEEENNSESGWTGPREVPDLPVPDPPPIDIIIENVIEIKPDVDDIVLYVYEGPNKDGSIIDIFDSNTPPDNHRRHYRRSPKKGGQEVSW